MPSYITDFTEGTKAAYEAQMIPLRAQAEADKIPLQKELDVQKIQQGRVEAETAKINLQNLMRTTAEDVDSREIMQNFYKDPANRALPLDEQTKKIAQQLAGKGHKETSLKWFEESSKATERDAKAAETRSKTEDRQMEHIRSWISDLSPDNVGQKIMIMQQSKEIPPQMAANIRQHLDQARGDPVAFAAVKKQMMDVYQSMDGRRLRAKEYKEEEDRRILEKSNDNKFTLGLAAQNRLAIANERVANRLETNQILNRGNDINKETRSVLEEERLINSRLVEIRRQRTVEQKAMKEEPVVTPRWGVTGMIPFVDKESIQYKEYAVKKDEYNTREEERKIVEQAAKARLAVLEGMKRTYNSQRTQLNKMLPENLKFEEPAVAPILETTPSTPVAKVTDMTPEEEDLAKKWLAKNPKDPGAPRVIATLERLEKERNAAKAAK